MEQPTKHPFEYGQRVSVLADDARWTDRVPVGTLATVVNCQDGDTCTRINFKIDGEERTSWMWNHELELVDASEAAA